MEDENFYVKTQKTYIYKIHIHACCVREIGAEINNFSGFYYKKFIEFIMVLLNMLSKFSYKKVYTKLYWCGKA